MRPALAVGFGLGGCLFSWLGGSLAAFFGLGRPVVAANWSAAALPALRWSASVALRTAAALGADAQALRGRV